MVHVMLSWLYYSLVGVCWGGLCCNKAGCQAECLTDHTTDRDLTHTADVPTAPPLKRLSSLAAHTLTGAARPRASCQTAGLRPGRLTLGGTTGSRPNVPL